MTRTLVPCSIIIAALAATSCQNLGTNAIKQDGLISPADSVSEREISEILNEDVRKAMSLRSADAQSQIASFEQNYAKGYISVASDGTVYTRSDIIREIREKGPNNRVFDSVRMEDTHPRRCGRRHLCDELRRSKGR